MKFIEPFKLIFKYFFRHYRITVSIDVLSMKLITTLLFIISLTCNANHAVSTWSPESLDLPDAHITRYLNSFPDEGAKCKNSRFCKYRTVLSTGLCWGYEEDCAEHLGYSDANCPGDHKGWVASKSQQLETFFKQTDFGFIKQQIESLKPICQPEKPGDSHLDCSQYLQFCQGSKVYIDFRDVAKRKEPFRYKMDVLKKGQIRGRCKLDNSTLKAEAVHISPLQSWGPEIQHFQETASQINRKSKFCDVYVERPTFIMKIDATVNMYHHFCDFFNLYTSMHVNGSHNKDMFSRDVNILIWESYTYSSNFGLTWSAFTKHPLWNLKTFEGKRVCFQNVVFPLLPRMIFGLYYNTPVIWGCQESGLFHAFSKFLLHRLKIPKRTAVGWEEEHPIRVTLLSRNTQYRRILNEKELLDKLISSPRGYIVKRVEFTHETDFRLQLQTIHETDILIGMHGAGLTHALFLPDWGAVFELYNCEDEHCYADLARLRGVFYRTWTDRKKLTPQDKGNHPDGGPHAKFTNYAFDPEEFLRIVDEAADHVAKHPAYLHLYQSPKSHLQDEL